MSGIPHIPSMRPEPKRDRWGRYVLPDHDGSERTWTRATTLSHAIDDTHGLTEWKRRMVLQGVATNPFLLNSVPGLVRQLDEAGHWREAKEAKEQLMALCDDAARAAGAEDGSKLGTLLHTITEYADAGRLAEIQDLIPAELLDDLAAYLVRMRDAGIETPPEWIERILINKDVETAGTTDRILIVPEPCKRCGSTLRIGDLKTQKSVDFGWLSIAIQLAEYAYSDVMVDTDTGELLDMPPVCPHLGIVMHLPVGSGQCTLYEIDLETGWTYAVLAHAVRGARNNAKAIGWRYEYSSRTAANIRQAGEAALSDRQADQSIRMQVVQKPEGERVSWVDREAQLRYLVSNAQTVDSLVALYREAAAAGTWTDGLNTLAKLRKAELLQEVTR